VPANLQPIENHASAAADAPQRWLAVFERFSTCARQVRRAMAECTERHGLSDVELSLLSHCRQAENGLSQAELATATGVSTAQISGIVEQLRERGLIAGWRDANDRRRQVWQLTPAGGELLVRALLELQPLAERLLPCWSEGAGEAIERLMAQCQSQPKHSHADDPATVTAETGKPKLRVVASLALLVCCLFSGCTRTFFRKWADNEAYDLVREKAQDPRWSLPDYTINIDPRSRMYDPSCPDFELEPPDDPAAAQLMKCVDGMRGDACWDWYGDTAYAQNPEWDKYLPRNEKGEVVADLTQAVQLALLNSRDYQRESEQLYLSALDVSFERFRFDVQFFGNNSTTYEAAGPMAPGAGGMSSSLLRNDTTFQARKLFASGGEFMVGLANSLVWQFSGSDSQFSTTLLDFSMLQPLLRGGGRAVVLERLTLSERVLLYNVRAMERYRRGFFTQVYAGNNPGDGPNRRGGVFGGAGLEGFSGIGGGFGTVTTASTQQQQAQANANFGVTGGAGAGAANGYVGLLQRQQEIRNQQSNVASLGGSVAQLDAAYAAGRIDRFQVDLARQALYNAQSRLMTDMTNYDNQVDNFKVTFGMPPQLTMLIRDRMLEPFELIDSRLAPLQNRMTRMQARLGDLIVALRDDARDPATLGTPQFREKVNQLRQALSRALDVERATSGHLPAVQKDIAEFR
jgi:DNA-binding MarR family transcriptional regulator